MIQKRSSFFVIAIILLLFTGCSKPTEPEVIKPKVNSIEVKYAIPTSEYGMGMKVFGPVEVLSYNSENTMVGYHGYVFEDTTEWITQVQMEKYPEFKVFRPKDMFYEETSAYVGYVSGNNLELSSLEFSVNTYEWKKIPFTLGSVDTVIGDTYGPLVATDSSAVTGAVFLVTHNRFVNGNFSDTLTFVDPGTLEETVSYLSYDLFLNNIKFRVIDNTTAEEEVLLIKLYKVFRGDEK